MKNTSMYILLDYRAKNYKQSINEILQGVIQKDKEKRKAERIKMMELMSIDTNESNNKDIEILNPQQVTSIRDQVFTIEKQVEFQKALVTSIHKKLQNFIGLPEPQRKKKRVPLSFIQSKGNDEFLEELNKIGGDYSKPVIEISAADKAMEDEEWVLKDAADKSANAWDQINQPTKKPRLDPKNANENIDKAKTEKLWSNQPNNM